MEEFEKFIRLTYGERKSLNTKPVNGNLDCFCPTCLSKDRDFYFLDGQQKHTLLILGVQVINTQIICWECYAMVNKILKFKSVALLAQKLLQGDPRLLDSVGSLSALKTTDMIKVLSITYGNDKKDPKTTVFISGAPSLQALRSDEVNSTTAKQNGSTGLSVSVDPTRDSDVILAHDNNLVQPCKNPASTYNMVPVATEAHRAMNSMHKTDSVVINQNFRTLEITDDVQLETESPFNDVKVSETVETPFKDFVVTNHTSEPSNDIKVFTLAVIPHEDSIKVNESVTALEISNVTSLKTSNAKSLEMSDLSLIDVKNSRTADILAENSLVNKQSVTKLETLNVTSIDTTETSLIDVKGYTPAVIAIEDSTEMNQSVTTLETSNITKLEIPNVTTLGTSNVTSLETLDPPVLNLVNSTPVMIPLEDSAVINQNIPKVETTSVTSLRTSEPSLNDFNDSTPVATLHEDSVGTNPSVITIETSKFKSLATSEPSLNDLNDSTPAVIPHEVSVETNPSVTTIETSKFTSLAKSEPSLNDVNDSTPAVIMHEVSVGTNPSVTTIETSKFISLATSEPSINDVNNPTPAVIPHEGSVGTNPSVTTIDMKKFKTAEIPLEHSVVSNHSITTVETFDAIKLKTQSHDARKDSVVVHQNTKRKRKQSGVTTQISELSLNNVKVPKTGGTPQEKIKAYQNIRMLKMSESSINNAKNSKTAEISLEGLIKSVINLSLNDIDDKMRNDISRKPMARAIDSLMRDSSETTDQVNDKAQSVKENFNNELNNLSEGNPSEIYSNVPEVDTDCCSKLMCMEELDVSLEDKDIEIERTKIPTNVLEINIFDENNTNSIISSAQNEYSETNLVKRVALDRNVIKTTAVIIPGVTNTHMNKYTEKITPKCDSRNIDKNMRKEKMKHNNKLIIHKITAGSPMEMKMSKQNIRRPIADTKKVNEYRKKLQSLKTLETVLFDHCYFRNHLYMYDSRIINLNTDLTSTVTPPKRINTKKKIIRAIRNRTVKKKINNEQLDVSVINDWEHELLNANPIDDSGNQLQDVLSMNEIHPPTMNYSNSNGIERNIEETRRENIDKEITLVTGVKVEMYSPEYSEENHETSCDFDSTVAICKIEHEEIDIKPEPLFEDDEDSLTDSASETSFLERFHCEPAFNCYNRVSVDTDFSKLSYYDYLYKPKDPYQNSPRNNDKILENNSNITSGLNNIEGEFEMNNITISFSDSLFSTDPTTELAEERIGNHNPITGVYSESPVNMTEDLLEPLYYTDWTDQTYEDHKQMTEPAKNITNEFSAQRHIEDVSTNTEMFNMKVCNVREQTRNDQSRRKRNRRSHLPPTGHEKATLQNEDYRKKLRVEPKKSKKHPKASINEPVLLKEMKYEKLFLRPVVSLEKIDNVLNLPKKKSLKMITKIKVEPTETVEEFLASNQTNVKDELSDEESYHEFEALIQELATEKTKHQKVSEANELERDEASEVARDEASEVARDEASEVARDEASELARDEANKEEKIKENKSESSKRKTNSNIMYTLRHFRDGEFEKMKEQTINSIKFKEADFKCFKCARIFGREQFLLRHIGFSHDANSGSLICTKCDCRFQTRTRLKNHSLTHARCYVCRWCPSEYLHLDMLKDHVEEAHPAEFEARAKKDKIYTCQICMKEYVCYTSMYLHLRITHKIESVCNKVNLADNEASSTEKNLGLVKYYSCSTDEMGLKKNLRAAGILRKTERTLSLKSKSRRKKRSKINKSRLTENNSSLTARSFGLWDYVMSLPDYNYSALAGNSSSVTENKSRITENDSILTENELSLTGNKSRITENDSILTENELSLTGNKSRITENDSILTENEWSLIGNKSRINENGSSLTENCSSLTGNTSRNTRRNSRLRENYLSLTGNKTKITENNSSLTGNRSSLTENNLDVTEINATLTENTLSIIENKSTLTENNLSIIENNSILTENELSLTGNKSTITENDSNLTENEWSLIGNKSRITENGSSLTENCSSLTGNTSRNTRRNSRLRENYLTLTGNKTKITENNSSLTGNGSSFTENNLDITEINATLTENTLSIIENKSTLTENNLSIIENNSILTENSLSITGNILNITENKPNLSENNLSLTETNSSLTRNKLSLPKLCPVCNKKFRSSSAYKSHFSKAHGSIE